MTLREIARALGGEVNGQRVLCPGPGHSGIDRSLSVRLAPAVPGGFVVKSFADDPFDLCRDYVASRLGLPSDYWRTKEQRHGAPHRGPIFVPREPEPEQDNTARIARAAALWDEAVPAQGTVVEVYLRSRRLGLPDGADILRFHPRCPWGDKALGVTLYVPCMVAAMRSVVDDQLVAIHRTRLTEDGRKVDRMMLGPVRGAAVKIDTVGADLVVGEGIETCLAARQMGFRPVWAAGSTSNIAALPTLPDVECLVLLGETGTASERAVKACSDRWNGAGRRVAVVEPAVGSDMNDALRASA